MTQGSGQRGQGQQGSDPVGDFQRWLLRSGARGLGREVRGNLRKTFGYGDTGRDDVWESATNEQEGGEPPECEWCPLCRAARKLRDSGPGAGSALAGAGDIVASAGDIVTTVVQNAFEAFEAVIAAAPRPGSPPGGAGPGSGSGSGSGSGDIVATVVQNAFDAFEAVIAAASGAGARPAGPGGPAAAPEQRAAAGELPEGPAGGPDDRG